MNRPIKDLKRQLLIIVTFFCLAGSVLFFKLTCRHLTGYGTYTFHVLFIIFILIPAILALDLYDRYWSPRATHFKSPKGFNWFNRRRSYRVIYPPALRPKIVVEMTDDTDRRELEFVVLDFSQDGVRFLDNGSLGITTHVSGFIHMGGGKIIPIHGQVVRIHGRSVSIQFREMIPWATLLEEQRYIRGIADP